MADVALHPRPPSVRAPASGRLLAPGPLPGEAPAPVQPPLDLRPAPPVALYVHVPFCLSICPYCDFVVYSGKAARGPHGRVSTLVEALLAEIRLRARDALSTFGRGLAPLSSVYFGGGTPSLLAPAEVARLMSSIESGFGIAPDAEVTIEANPGPGERGDLRGFRAAGVNRLSVGAQTMVATELRTLGRRHRPADVLDTVREARRSGLTSVSLDLLYDVPGQTPASWQASLDAALALGPDHVSAYALTLDDPDADGLTGSAGDHLPLRPGARRWRERARANQDDDRAAACYALADRALSAAGLRWYELSNWAAPGKTSRHNLCYWRREAHEAVGPGAHAFDGACTRRWNAARLDAYLGALLPGKAAGLATLPPGGRETVDPATAAAERAILALRLRDGLAAEPRFAAALAWGRQHGLLTPASAGRLRLTIRGRLLASELFARLLPDTGADTEPALA